MIGDLRSESAGRRRALLIVCLAALLVNALVPFCHDRGLASPAARQTTIAAAEGGADGLSHDCATCPLCRLASQAKHAAPCGTAHVFHPPLVALPLRAGRVAVVRATLDLSATVPRAPPSCS